MNVRETALAAGRAAQALALASTGQKNDTLRSMAERIWSCRDELLTANRDDVTAAETAGFSEAVVKRLGFSEAKIRSRQQSLNLIADLPDPVGQSYWHRRLPNGLEACRVRVPLGVILMIYEARPHVTVNAGAFCLKAGNSAILRGGSEAQGCNEVLGRLWRESLASAGLPATAIQVISGSHAEIADLLILDDCIDLVIPRGGKSLIHNVAERSRIPVVKHFEGICHVYLDSGADLDRGLAIALDSKCLMPEVCNAMETLLVHESLTGALPRIGAALEANGVRVRGCPRVCAAFPGAAPAVPGDWRTEYLDLVLSVRVVSELSEAIEHINTYGSHHTDAIVTDSESRARRFLREVDSGVVLVNASTMFCDGRSLGMGAEIGISTDKIHARGLMGLEELTSYKFAIRGAGHVMGEAFAERGTGGEARA